MRRRQQYRQKVINLGMNQRRVRGSDFFDLNAMRFSDEKASRLYCQYSKS